MEVGDAGGRSNAMRAVGDGRVEIVGWTVGVGDARKAARPCFAGSNKKYAARLTAPRMTRVKMPKTSDFLLVSVRIAISSGRGLSQFWTRS